MSWVIAATTRSGCVVLVSDSSVVFPDGTERDLIRKSFPLVPLLAVGFAGSVRLGLELISRLRAFLAEMQGEMPNGWEPFWVAKDWARTAQYLFETASSVEQRLGCQLMLVGIDPRPLTLRTGSPNICFLKSPDFGVGSEYTLGRIHSIGNVSASRACRQVIQEAISDQSPEAVITSIEELQTLGDRITSRLAELPNRHVRPRPMGLLHVTLLSAAGSWTGTSGCPNRVASSYDELLALVGENANSQIHSMGAALKLNRRLDSALCNPGSLIAGCVRDPRGEHGEPVLSS